MLIPVGELSLDGVQELLSSGFGSQFLVPVALDHLERDPELFEVLRLVLNSADFPWDEFPEEVRRARTAVSGAFNELNQWDGSPEVVANANRQRFVLMEAWANFERRLSRIE